MIIMHSLEKGVDDVSIEPLLGFHRQLVIEIYPIITTSLIITNSRNFELRGSPRAKVDGPEDVSCRGKI